ASFVPFPGDFSMKTRITCSCLFLVLACVCASGQVKSNADVVEIPFDFVRNEILLQVKVNGKGPFNMMRDTGTEPSAIDLETAKELGLKLSSAGGPVSGGGTARNLAYETKLPL